MPTNTGSSLSLSRRALVRRGRYGGRFTPDRAGAFPATFLPRNRLRTRTHTPSPPFGSCPDMVQTLPLKGSQSLPHTDIVAVCLSAPNTPVPVSPSPPSLLITAVPRTPVDGLRISSSPAPSAREYFFSSRGAHARLPPKAQKEKKTNGVPVGLHHLR